MVNLGSSLLRGPRTRVALRAVEIVKRAVRTRKPSSSASAKPAGLRRRIADRGSVGLQPANGTALWLEHARTGERALSPS
jgi:hypothetical protein